MITENTTSSIQKAAPKKARGNGSSTALGERKRTISPAQRWLLISENVHKRAQKRGFVGGDPFEDLLEAEQEVDAAYDTDFEGVFSLTDVSEITKQLKSVFACYGCDHRDLDQLMDRHHEAVEKLAAFNLQLVDSTSELAQKQTNVLQDVASEAVKTLQSFTKGWIRPEGVVKQAELSMQAFDNALSHFRTLTNSVAEISKPPQSTPASQKSVLGAVNKAYEGTALKDLVEAPAAAIKGISATLGSKLEKEFGIKTIREMATNKFAEWASGIVLLADTEGGMSKRAERSIDKVATDGSTTQNNLEAVADGPIEDVPGISQQQAKLFRDGFRIRTVRDLANNRFFTVARGIAMLADAED